ncbi:MAG: hypothetical protein AAB482_02000, partial [Patescibacteria group bacterium]
VLFWSENVYAVTVGDTVTFNVDKGFDFSGRAQIQANLVKVGNKIYFYVEKAWWDLQAQTKQDEVLANLDNLSNEFDNNIYPIVE